MTMSDVKQSSFCLMSRAGVLVILLCLLLLAGCGESSELKIEQARIALANEKPDRALLLVDSVLAEDPENYDALLIQAQAQIVMGRLGPAKFTLDRIARDRGSDPAVAQAFLNWSINTIDGLVENPAFAITPTDQQAYVDARSVADVQLGVLRAQAGFESEAFFSEALIARGDLQHARILIKHTERMIEEFGVDGLIHVSRAGEQQAESPEPPDTPDAPDRPDAPDDAGPTYGQQLESLKLAEADALELLLSDLESVLQVDSSRGDAAVLFMRVAAGEAQWDRLLAQARLYSEVTDLPLLIAEQTISMLLRMPDATATMAQRIELGQAILRSTPAEQSQDEQRLISSAKLMMAGGQNDKALPILAKLIDDGSAHADAFMLYAYALYDSGDNERCREILERMLPDAKAVSAVQTLYGLTLWRLGEFGGARDALREACRLDPSNKQAIDAFANVMAQQGMLGASRDDIDAFYELDPTNPRAIQFKLQHAAASGDTQQAATIIEELERRPDHSPVELGLLYSANTLLGRYNAAEEWARKLIVLKPEAQENWMRLAAAQLRQEDELGLEATLGEISKRFPDAPGAAQITGELYFEIQQYERSAAALGMAVEEDAGNLEARIALARALAAIGRFNSALDEVKQVLDVEPDNAQALALGARIAGTRDEDDLADEYLSRIDPDQVDAVKDPALAAQVRISRGELDEAEAICTKAIASGNSSPLLRLVLAGIYQEKGEPERAEEHLVALVRHYPNSAEVYAWLGQFYVSAGLTEEGLQKLKSVEVYNEPLAVLAQAGMLRAADRQDDAILLLDPMLDRMIHRHDPMAPTVAEAISQLHKQNGDTLASEAVFSRLYKQQASGATELLDEVLSGWDTDTPARRLAKLDAASVRVPAGDTPALIELSRRYAMLGRPEQSLVIVQRGLAETPENEALLGVKAGVLVLMGRADEAVAAYRQAMDQSPEDRSLRVRYARALSKDGQWPEAENELMLLVREDSDVATLARTALLEVYLELGLYERAASSVDAVLDKLQVGEDAALDLMIGKVLMARDRHAEAQHHYASVSADSPYYPAARVMHALSQVELGDLASAQEEITRLVKDPAMSRRTLAILLAWDPLDESGRPLLVSADQAADPDQFSYDLSQRWLAMRLRLADIRGDWVHANETLARIAQANDEDAVTTLRAVLLYQLGDTDEAANLLRQAPGLERSAAGSLLAFALGSQPPKTGRVHPMMAVLSTLDEGDRGQLESVASGYYGIKTLFVDDLLAVCPDGERADETHRAGYRDLAMAVVALEGRMPGLAEALCESALKRTPDNLTAIALLAAAKIDLGRDFAGLADRTRRIAPGSSLSLMLDVTIKAAVGDHGGTLTSLRELTARHAGNPYLRYQLAQELSAVGQSDEAAERFKLVAEAPGPYQLAAKNDLAFLRAQNGGDSLNEAVGLAREVLKVLPSNPAVLDTAGWIEHLRGRNETALGMMTRSIIALSDVPEAHYHLGAVYHAMGQDRWARYHLQQAAAGTEGERGVTEAQDLLSEVADTVAWP